MNLALKEPDDPPLDRSTSVGRLFAALDARCGKVAFHEDLIADVGIEGKDGRAALKLYVCQLRDRLPAGCEILTIQNKGYMLVRL